MMPDELRYGAAASLYAKASQSDQRQLDLLNEWFHHLLIKEEESDGNTKVTPYFSDQDCLIHAVRYHERLYSGADDVIAQLCGRLIGLAKGNREKQRKSAVIMQKHVTRVLCSDYGEFETFLANAHEHLCVLDDETLKVFVQDMYEYIIAMAEKRAAMSESERDGEPFPMDDEIFDTVVYNAAYQLNLGEWEGLVKAYAWLLLGSLLRNEAGRITRRYDSSFNEVNRMPSEEPSLLSKLDYLFFPEDYEYTYEGDDFESRFPDITWKCDRCGDILNHQEGFDDHLDQWTCTRCGMVNPIGPEHIYENNEDADNRRMAMDEEKMADAVERRKRELDPHNG